MKDKLLYLLKAAVKYPTPIQHWMASDGYMFDKFTAEHQPEIDTILALADLSEKYNHYLDMQAVLDKECLGFQIGRGKLKMLDELRNDGLITLNNIQQ